MTEKGGTIPYVNQKKFLGKNGVFICKQNIMGKIIRLTESDLTRLVKRVISEQSLTPEQQEQSKLGLKLRTKYKNKICGSSITKLPFDADVKRYQELSNKISYSGARLKVDGIIGPEMKKEFCTQYA